MTFSLIIPSGMLKLLHPIQYSMISKIADLPVEDLPVITFKPSKLKFRSRLLPVMLYKCIDFIFKV